MLLTRAGGRTAYQFWVATAAVGAILLTAGAIDLALAQGTPFGVGAPKGPASSAPSSGIVGWIMVKQAEFYKGLSGAIRAARTDWSARCGRYSACRSPMASFTPPGQATARR